MKKLLTIAMLTLSSVSYATEMTSVWASQAMWQRDDGREFFMYARVHNDERDWKIDFPVYDPTCTKGRTDFQQKVKINGKKIKIVGGCIDDNWFGLVPVEKDQKEVFREFFRNKTVTMVIDNGQKFTWSTKGMLMAVQKAKNSN